MSASSGSADTQLIDGSLLEQLAWDPTTDKECAPWAPREGEVEAAGVLQSWLVGA